MTSSSWEKYEQTTTGDAAHSSAQHPSSSSSTAFASILDPYARWGEASEWRGFARASGWEKEGKKDEEYFQIIARARNGEIPEHEKLNVASVYREAIPGTKEKSEFFTARVRRRDRAWLMKNPLGLIWELALPLRDADTVARTTAQGRYAQSRDMAAFEAKNVLSEALERSNTKTLAQGLGDTIAIIDFGCPFLNPRFADKDERVTRIKALWDQGSEPKSQNDPGWPWQPPTHFDHGRELGPSAIRTMYGAVVHAQSDANHSIEETTAYRGIDYLIAYDDPRRRVWLATHGAHVLDVAGGTIDPITGRAGDYASTAILVFVQLPSLTAADSAGGSLSANILDGLRYVLSVCQDTAKIVVNISYGTFAGPHDGSSQIELAMDELLRSRPKNFAIVLAAGNARQAACHAQRQVLAGRGALLRLMSVPGDTTDTFAEIWYDASKQQSELEVRVRPPERNWSSWIKAGGQAELKDDATKEVVAMLRHDKKVPNGKKSLILLAMSPTAAPDNVPTPLATPGVWEIEIQLAKHDAKHEPINDSDDLQRNSDAENQTLGVTIDAWIERDDPGERRGEQAHWLGLDADDDKNTLNSLATGPHTVAVGGFRLCDATPTSYSSIGQNPHDDTPLIVFGACEEDAVNSGIRGAAVRASEVFRMNGTSVAAPVVTRRLFNWMKAGNTIRFNTMKATLKGMIAQESKSEKESAAIKEALR